MTASPHTQSNTGRPEPAVRLAAVTAVRAATEVCRRCGATNLRPRSRMYFKDRLIAFLFSVFPYMCHTCDRKERRFRLTWRTFAMPAGVLAIAGCICAAATFSFDFGQDKTARDSSDLIARTRSAAGGQLSAYEQLMIHKPKQTMDNATVLKLWDAHMSPSVILQLIRTSNSDYDVTADSLIELKRAGVDETVILAMVNAAYREH